MSEDSDIAAHGCNHIIKNYKKSGECQVLNASTLENLWNKVNDEENLKDEDFKSNFTKMTKALDFLALSDTTKMKVSIYSGCDYVDNIKGVGFGTLINYTDTEQELDDFIDVILKKGSSILPDGMDNVEEYKI